MNIHDGGPAFPQVNEQRYSDPVHGVIRPSDMYGDAERGMTLRDYFAAKAMAGWNEAYYRLAYELHDATPDADAIANTCYRLADAMLDARKPKPDPAVHPDDATPERPANGQGGL